LYVNIFQSEVQQHHGMKNPADILRWTIQNNNHSHLLNLTQLPISGVVKEDFQRAMCEAVQRVIYPPTSGVRIQMSLNRTAIPPILNGNLCFLRVQITKENIPPHFIPTIIKSNPALRRLIVVQHITQYGSHYLGNCTKSEIPLLPGQYQARPGGTYFTIPGFELLYDLRRSRYDPKVITQRWRSYRSGRDGGRKAVEELPKLNVFGIQDWNPPVWPTELLERLKIWEDEVRGWMELDPALSGVGVVLNTNREKFGTVEKYWCTCVSDI
jgi:hypothetical protein